MIKAYLPSGFSGFSDEDDERTTTTVDAKDGDCAHQGCPFSWNDVIEAYLGSDGKLYIVRGIPRDRTVSSKPEFRFNPNNRDYSWSCVTLPADMKPETCHVVGGEKWTIHVYEQDCRTYAIYDAMTCALIEQGIRDQPVDLDLVF